MSDWEFLHDMHNDGYSPEQIAEAAACGYNPWEWEPVDEMAWAAKRPQADPRLFEIFGSLVESAASYYAITGRYLQIWGELGELFAEVAYGIRRHKPHTRGSDGRLGNDLVEVKTISPEKDGDQTKVKRSGNFSRLLVVRISEDFAFEGRMVARKQLAVGDGKHARVSWSTLSSIKQDPDV
jgi:hypothetical protein